MSKMTYLPIFKGIIIAYFAKVFGLKSKKFPKMHSFWNEIQKLLTNAKFLDKIYI